MPEDRLFPISAVTGRGVREAVTAVRSVLDELGPAEVVPETDALNITQVPRRFAPEVSHAAGVPSQRPAESSSRWQCVDRVWYQ